jgi:hypothetical protein
VAFYRERITEDRLPEPGEQVILRSRDIAALEQEAGPAAVFRPVHRAGPVLLLRREPDLGP